MAEPIPAGAIPADQFQPDAAPSGVPPGAIPADEFESDQDKFGSGTEQFKTAIEQGLSGATLGLSKVAETHLLGVKPEDIAAREAANPITSFVSNLGGGAATLIGTGGLSGLAEGAGLATKLGVGALEGAGIAGINQANDDWSQNKSLDAQKIAASAGLGALLGGAGAGLGEYIKYKAGTPLAKNAAQTVEDSEAVAPGEAAPAVVETPGTKGVKPTSLGELQKAVEKAKLDETAIDLPQKAELMGVLSRVEMENPVNPAQIDSLGSQNQRDLYQIAKESLDETGSTLKKYEAIQKQELVSKLGRAVQDIAPGSEIESDAYKAGQSAIDAFTNQYQSEKEALKPIFKALKQTDIQGDILPDAIVRMTNAVPGVAEMFDTSGAEIAIKPYKTTWGIDKATYNAVKEAVDSLSGADNTLEALWNVRKGLDQHIDVLSQGQAPGEIRALKTALMDQMQDSSGNPTIREAFKRYAINEQNRSVIEKAFGAGVGTSEFGAISKIKPEKIGDRIFSNTATVDAAKKILPPEQFDSLLANWIAKAQADVTDKGVFSSNKFGTWLRKNQYALASAFQDSPGELQNLRDLTTIMRILPDAPYVNPSGTAKTVVQMLKQAKFHDMTWEGLLASIPKKVVEKIGEYNQAQQLNKALAGQAAQNSTSDALKAHVDKISSKLDRGVKALFSSSASQVRKR